MRAALRIERRLLLFFADAHLESTYCAFQTIVRRIRSCYFLESAYRTFRFGRITSLFLQPLPEWLLILRQFFTVSSLQYPLDPFLGFGTSFIKHCTVCHVLVRAFGEYLTALIDGDESIHHESMSGTI